MRRKSRPEPRFTLPEYVQEGDTIRVSTPFLDARRSVIGTVHRIRDDGQMRSFYTKRGVILLSWYFGSRSTARVTLLDVDRPNTQTVIDGL